MPLPGREHLPARENAQVIAYTELKDWIINGPLEAGEPIRDIDVAEMLGVSRTPVREALIRLSQEGFVTIAPGRSTRVAPLPFDRAPHLYSLGGALDIFAAQSSMANLTLRDLQEMRALLEKMEASKDVQEVQSLDEQFHLVYFKASRNPVLVEMIGNLNEELRRLERVAFSNSKIRAEAHQEHLMILDALTNKDTDAAAKAISQNWNGSWSRIHAWIEPGLVNARPAKTRTRRK